MEAWGEIRVQVVNAAGLPEPGGWAEPVNCPFFRPAPASGNLAPLELAYTAAEGRCVLMAVRMDGMVRTEGEPASFHVPPDDVVRVQLTLPAERTGIIYFAFAPTDRGALLRWIPPGSILDRAGLKNDDVIVSIDGMALGGLEPEEILEAMNGPEGSTVLLEVELAEVDTGPATLVLELVREVFEG